MTTLNWQIDYLQSSTKEIEGYQEVVVQAGWRLNGEEDTATTSLYGSVSFLPPQHNDPNFIPYNELTQDQVLEWVWKSGVDKEVTEAAVTQRLDETLNPAEVQLPLPWVMDTELVVDPEPVIEQVIEPVVE